MVRYLQKKFITKKESIKMKKNILVVEDDRDARDLIKIYLKKWNYSVYESSNGHTALEILKTNYIHIAIIDWILPGMSGIELCKKIRDINPNNYIYIIIITGKKTREDVIEALSNGADDYIIKPFNFEELKVRIEAGLRIVKYHENLKSCYEMLYKESLIDSLTKVLNRKAILNRLEVEFERHKRFNDELCVIMGDIDFFKKINDTYGHLAGDEVLRQLGQLFNNSLRKYDCVGRYGGEEFLIILPHTEKEVAIKVANRMRETIKNHNFIYNSLSLDITMSFGIASSLYAETPLELINLADIALYRAKKKGRDKVEIY